MFSPLAPGAADLVTYSKQTPGIPHPMAYSKVIKDQGNYRHLWIFYGVVWRAKNPKISRMFLYGMNNPCENIEEE